MLKPEFQEKPAGKVVLAPTLGPAVPLFCFPLQAKRKYWVLALNKIELPHSGRDGAVRWGERRGQSTRLNHRWFFTSAFPPWGTPGNIWSNWMGHYWHLLGKGWGRCWTPCSALDSSPQWRATCSETPAVPRLRTVVWSQTALGPPPFPPCAVSWPGEFLVLAFHISKMELIIIKVPNSWCLAKN